MSTYESGNTLRLTATFRDFDDVLTDPTGITFTGYEADRETIIETGTPTNGASTGIFLYRWTAPSTPGTYFWEFKGTISGKPALKRGKFSVKFDVVE